MKYTLTVDSGGTFTDIVAIDETGKTTMTKAHTTPADVTIGTMNAIEKMAGRLGISQRELLGDTGMIVHGTTQATNIVATMSGAKVGGIFSQGFRDRLTFLHVAKADMDSPLTERYARMYDFDLDYPEQLAERRCMVDIEERLLNNGDVWMPLNEEDVRAKVRFLKDEKCDSIAVCLLYSYLNNAHELRVAEIIKEEYPEASVSLSHQVIPIQGEVRRWSTTMFDAYVAPKIRGYVDRIFGKLRDAGYMGTLVFMQCNGGVASPEVVKTVPTKLLISGPAAGPSTAIALGKPHGINNIISVDMGGTSFDAAVIPEGRINTTNDLVIHDKKFALPAIEVNAIGAGGGSIASVDNNGKLQVGPKSAGGAPGPACYGIGGTEPTVTDADVVLGYIDPDYFLGGETKLDKSLSEKVIEEKVAKPLGLTVPEAAAAIYTVINNKMAHEVELVFSRKGYDPRDFMIIGAGGASAVHVAKIAQDLGISGFMIPKMAPVYCAYGMLYADVKHDYIRSYFGLLDEFDFDKVDALFGEMEAEGRSLIEKDGVDSKEIEIVKRFDIKYYGETRDMSIELPGPGAVTKETLSYVADVFHETHERVIGNSNPAYPLQIVALHLSVSYKTKAPSPLRVARGNEDASEAIKGRRDAWFDGKFQTVNIYDGESMKAGNIVEGPCIIEEQMTTLVVPAGFRMELDDYGNYLKKS
jgi:N-methylhydantoinase A